VRLFLSILFALSLWAVPFPPERAPSPPFITGDAFRAYADYVYDELDSRLDPNEVKPRSVIFVRTALLSDFFSKIHEKIAGPYVLITHITDESVPGPYAPFLDDEKLLGWFGINWDGTEHPKMHPIPIGVANRIWPSGNPDSLLRVMEKKWTKSHLAYMNFTIQTFSPERWKVFKQFAFAPFCYRTGKKRFEEYLEDAAQSIYIMSPRGFGLDTYRLWEALYLGCIPVVKSSSLDRLYAGLPVLIVPEWEGVTEEFLRAQQVSGSTEKLSMDYWIHQIEEVRR
jgi:hypothetical protein